MNMIIALYKSLNYYYYYYLLCFYQPIRDGLFWIRPEVRILGADQKDRSLWELPEIGALVGLLDEIEHDARRALACVARVSVISLFCSLAPFPAHLKFEC